MRGPELNREQREVAVKLIRGLVLEHQQSSVVLAKAFADKGFTKPNQRTISAYMHRLGNCGREVAENVAALAGHDWHWYFEDMIPAVYGDLSNWLECERTAKKSARGGAYAPSSFYAVKYKLLPWNPVHLTTRVLLDMVADFQAHATPRTFELVGAWIENDSDVAHRGSLSRVRTS